MINLSVNINKVALIRNSRGQNQPDLVQFAKDCEMFGAQGITVHPRPDERHVRFDDLPLLKNVVTTEFNIEGYPNEKFLSNVEAVGPHQCTLVPDPPGVLTSDEGWDTKSKQGFLKEVIERLHASNIRVSLFLDPDPELVRAAKDTGADRIELYTGQYAKSYVSNKEEAILPHRNAAEVAQELGLGLNAGHDLNLTNLKYYAEEIPGLKEVSIGHAIICDSLYYGIQNVIGMYRELLIVR